MSSLYTKLETLALHGGTPVREKLLPYGRQSLDDEDIQAVVEVLKSDWLTTGPKVDEFEEAFAEWVGARFAVSFSSGTAALHGAAFAADLGPGDEAITTPITFCATANCVLYQGAMPLFADVCEDTLNLDPQAVSRKLSSRTRAIIAVDYAGHPAAIAELRAIANARGARLIEDACHALGTGLPACAHAVANRLCVCTTPPIPANARYNTKCVGVSELGFNLPSTTLPSARETTTMCSGRISE